jgi:hypothetical protein
VGGTAITTYSDTEFAAGNILYASNTIISNSTSAMSGNVSSAGKIVNVKIIDVASQQMIADMNVRF